MFKYNFFAWLFIVAPILILLYYFRFKDRVRIWETFQKPKKWATDIKQSDTGSYFWRKAIIICSLLLIIIALMRPQFGERFETIEREGRMIFFIVDTSLSMLAEDGAKTRMDLAKYHIQQFLPKINDDMISIIPYSNTAYTYLPLTTDISAVNMFIEDMYVGMIGSSGTDITNALSYTKDVIEKNEFNTKSTIIIFSDGEFKPNLQIEKVNEMFKGKYVDAIVVGLGSVQGEPIPLRDESNQIIKYKKDSAGQIVLSKRLDRELEQLAEALNGIYINGEPSPLVAEKMYSFLSTIETQNLEAKQLVTKIDRYHWVLFLSLILLLFDIVYPIMHQRFFQAFSMMVIIMLLPIKVNAAHPGVESYQDQKYGQAEAEFNKELNKRPNDGKLIFNLANTYYQQGDYDRAIQAYSESIDYLEDMEKTEALYNIGTTYLTQKNFKEALNAYKEVLKQDPNHIKTKQNIELALKQQQMQQSQSSGDGQTNDGQNNDAQSSASQAESQENQDENNDEEGQSISENDEDNEDNDSTSSNQEDDKEELSENQLQYLVDIAEKEAREKRRQKRDALFEGDTW